MREISYIYTLSHPLTGEVRYVGKANNVDARLKTHIRDSVNRKTPIYAWVRKLLGNGLKPSIQVICSTWEWENVEKLVISEMRKDGVRLLNVADGGPMPHFSNEQASINGKKTVKVLAQDPFKLHISKMKRFLSSALKEGVLSDYAKNCMKESAKKNPKLFGAWAAI